MEDQTLVPRRPEDTDVVCADNAMAGDAVDERPVRHLERNGVPLADVGDVAGHEVVQGLVDLAALTGGAGRRWAPEPYALSDLLSGKEHPREVRWPR